jgi:hypothetical protein
MFDIVIPSPKALEEETLGANAKTVAELVIAQRRSDPKQAVSYATLVERTNGWWDIQKDDLVKFLQQKFSEAGWNFSDNGSEVRIEPA